MRNSIAAIVFLGVSFGVSANAQPSIQLCGTTLTPGMTKDATLKAVSGGCEVKQISTSPSPPIELWCARPSNSKAALSDSCPGLLDFTAGSLAGVTKTIGKVDGDVAADIANHIYMFAKTASEEGQVVTVAPSFDHDDDGWRIRMVRISAGQRILTLTTIQPIGKPNAISEINLEESLNAPK